MLRHAWLLHSCVLHISVGKRPKKKKKKKNQQLTKKIQNVVSAMEEVSRSSQLIAEEGKLLITSREVT